jgi:transcriptional regulator with XRE-family HTH domain
VDQAFDLRGALRRIRRLADLSQRELAVAASVSAAAVAHAEAGTRDLPVASLARAAGAAGLRLALLDGAGHEVRPLSDEVVRDLSGRRFPAHLDTRRSDEGTWLYEPRRDRPETSFTFDRNRDFRDRRRVHLGTPADHLLAVPGDSPRERAAERRRSALRARAEERERRFLAGEFARLPDAFVCTCPAECDELDDRSGRPVHARNCPCGCDLA